MSEKRKKINTAALLRNKQGLIESIKSKLEGETKPMPVKSDDETGLSLKPDFMESAEPITVTLPKEEPITIMDTPSGEENISFVETPAEEEEVPAPETPAKEETAPVTETPAEEETAPQEEAAHVTETPHNIEETKNTIIPPMKGDPTAPRVETIKESAPTESLADIKKKFLGKWTVISHTTSGDDFRLYFEMSHLNGLHFKNVTISETFDFSEKSCIKETEIEGTLDDDRTYHYRLNLNTSYRIPRDGILEITVDTGYLSHEYGGEPASVKEYIGDGKSDETGFRFNGETLILEDVYRDDKKKLAKIGG